MCEDAAFVSPDMTVTISPPEDASGSLSSSSREVVVNSSSGGSVPLSSHNLPSPHSLSRSGRAEVCDASSSPLFQKILQSRRLSLEGPLSKKQSSSTTCSQEKEPRQPQFFHQAVVHASSLPSPRPGAKVANNSPKLSAYALPPSSDREKEDGFGGGEDETRISEDRVTGGGGGGGAEQKLLEKNRGSLPTAEGNAVVLKGGHQWGGGHSSPVRRPVLVSLSQKADDGGAAFSSPPRAGLPPSEGEGEEERAEGDGAGGGGGGGGRESDGRSGSGQKIVRVDGGEFVSIGGGSKDLRGRGGVGGVEEEELVSREHDIEDEEDLPVTCWRGRLRKKWLSMPWFRDLHAEVTKTSARLSLGGGRARGAPTEERNSEGQTGRLK